MTGADEWYWPSPERPGRAVITPAEYGTWGIAWEGFPALERRGGWSGPYRTAEEAAQGARNWIESYDLPEGSVLIVLPDESIVRK